MARAIGHCDAQSPERPSFAQLMVSSKGFLRLRIPKQPLDPQVAYLRADCTLVMARQACFVSYDFRGQTRANGECRGAGPSGRHGCLAFRSTLHASTSTMSMLYANILLLFTLGSALGREILHREGFNVGPGVNHVELSTAGGYEWPYQVFKSSTLNPPLMQINTTVNASSLAPGLIFLTIAQTTSAVNVTKLSSPQIFADDGRFVWAQPAARETHHHQFQMATLPGQAHADAGGAYGDCDADLHESYIVSERNTILSSAYNATPTDLTSVGGPSDGWAWEGQFTEIDPSRARIATHWTSTDPYDYFHINSVVNLGEYYLVNGRHVWTTYLLDKQGSIVWRFAGDTGGDFGPLPDNGHFRWQHFARPHNITNSSLVISWFNNNNNGQGEPIPTDLLVYSLPLRPKPNSTESQATLISNFHTPDNLYADSQGSFQYDLSNGNSFATYGQLPFMREFDASGELIWSANVGPANLAQTYRGFKKEWHATPWTQPDLAVERDNSTTGYFGYTSWNGATDVDEWNVYAGEWEWSLLPLGQVDFQGFETRFNLPSWAKYVQVGGRRDGRFDGQRWCRSRPLDSW
ncbi:hypothetical protein MRB53_041314 [Persea americana]|nr:hypothetical protein MRB53_041314 [Persea americana]